MSHFALLALTLFVSAYFAASDSSTSTGTTGTSSGDVNFSWNYLGSSEAFDSSGRLQQAGLAWNNWTIVGDAFSGKVTLSAGDTAGQYFQTKLSGTYSPAGAAQGVFTVALIGQINDLQQKVVLSLNFNATAYLDGTSSQGGTEVTLIGSSPVSVGGQVLGDNYLTATLTPNAGFIQGIFSLYPNAKFPAFMTYSVFQGQNKA